MVYLEFRRSIEDVLNMDIDIKTTNRFLGLCYGIYMYVEACKDLKKVYEPEQIVQAVRMTKEYYGDMGFESVDHKINAYIAGARKNLEWHFNIVEFDDNDEI